MVDLKNEKQQLRALESLFKQKRFSDALAIAKKLNHDFPNSFQIKFLYVRTLKELNKLAEAEEELKELMLLFPNNVKLLLESGNISLELDKIDNALEYYNKILFLDPFNEEAKNSIDKIEAMKKRGLGGGEKEVDFITYQQETLDNADTLPEFDNKAIHNQIQGKEEVADSPPLNLEPEDRVEPSPVLVQTPEVKEPFMPSTIPEADESESKEPEPAEDKEMQPAAEAEGTEFVTESAALLYLEQELFDDAMVIYEKLYGARKEEKYLLKIKEIEKTKELKRQQVIRKKINVLTEFLGVIQQRCQAYQQQEGDQIV